MMFEGLRRVRYEEVPVGELRKPPYQRDEGHQKALLEEMAKDGWVEALAQPLDVIERKDGSKWVVDGMTRLIHAIRCGREKVWCRVLNFEVDDLTVESEIFEWLNQGRTRVSIDILFRNALMRGSKVETEIKEAVEAGGASIDLDKSRVSRSTNAIGALKRIYRDYGKEVLERAVRVALSAWPSNSVEALAGMRLEGIAAYLGDKGDVKSEDRLVKAMSKRTPSDFTNAALAAFQRDARDRVQRADRPPARVTREHHRQALVEWVRKG